MADQGSEGLLSPYLRCKRIEAVRPYLKGNILDVGCGSGALAQYVSADFYAGVDPDKHSLSVARQQFPNHQFYESLPDADRPFNTIVSLAVIEHVSDPILFLRNLLEHLGRRPDDVIVCTTPHPSVDWLHTLGASMKLFSSHASEEHEELLDKPKLEKLAAKSGLLLATYRRFLFGANQIAVFHRAEQLC
jgi:2-polyprenyl-3-methyl-5-hydroxy-6-metoxy-1,4-benzoquinol methylase